MPSTERKLLDTREAAALLGVKPGTLEMWRSQSRGPRFLRVSKGKRGGLIRYRHADILKWIDQHLVETREAAGAR